MPSTLMIWRLSEIGNYKTGSKMSLRMVSVRWRESKLRPWDFPRSYSPKRSWLSTCRSLSTPTLSATPLLTSTLSSEFKPSTVTVQFSSYRPRYGRFAPNSPTVMNGSLPTERGKVRSGFEQTLNQTDLNHRQPWRPS